MRRPTAAERARTLAYGIAGGMLVTAAWEEDPARADPPPPVPAHATDLEGRPLLLVPADAEPAVVLRDEPDLAATLEIADVAPLPLADRLRGRAWLHGWLTAPQGERLAEAALRLSRLHPRPELLDVRAGRTGEWTILALEVAEVEICDPWGHAVVEPEAYQAALPDPFVIVEHRMLAHLDACHGAELVAMVRHRFGPADGDLEVRPFALDRHGLWLRCFFPDSDLPSGRDLYVEFPDPVSDLHGLRQVCRRLLVSA
ncbi:MULTISPECIES: DUF2470 domain-containing protein [Thermomonospora]|uniref:DUF2470 domain-containing protein n=1 Tax=Thermomonospora cellulosilytica TaxID=1411118 RepID=A0A7W3N507_9ACTN|nr:MULTISPECIES: DUF2470 domain-containing protein [Thermomonospora]MBA9007593.1 hypothetical protein [Thermomonospora cellulosilytica]